MPWYKRVQEVDRRIIYVLMLLAIAVPLIKPIGMPITVQQATQDAYNTLANLPAGSNVLLSFDTSASSQAETKPAAQAIFRLCASKGHKIFIYGTWADGPTLASQWLAPVIEETGYKYGEQYINFGYRAAPTAILETARTDLVKALGGQDMNKKNLADFPIMKGVTKASNFNAVVNFNSGDPGITDFIAQWYATGEVKTIIGAVTAVEIPQRTNQYRAGQLKGLVGGLGGAAEFEKLIGKPGSATTGMDAQSLGHLVVIIFLIVGNVGYLAAKKAGDAK
ncbi:MAG: hypothetical protein ACM3ZQ_05655 [Bacillota bacterium]